MLADRVMAGQHGVITWEQARDCGLSPRQIRYRIELGSWQRVHHRVYRHTAVPGSWQQQLLAATLAADAVASHESAVLLFGLNAVGRQPSLHVTRPHDLGPRRAAGVTVHRSTQWAARQQTVRRGIRCTGIERTLMDTAGMSSVDRLERLAEDAVRRRLTSFGSLATYLAWHGRQGRTGAGTLRAMLLRRAPDAPLPLSDFSRAVTQLLIRAGLPEPAIEHRVFDRHGRFVMQADLAWPDLRKIVELDGLAWHFGRADVERDRRKRSRARADGWRIQEVLWSMYREDPQGLAELIGDFLRS